MADNYIPKERLTAYEKYELAAFDAPPTPRVPVTTVESHELAESALPVTPLPTAEELERIHEEARQAGYDAGYAEGRAQGYDEGYKQGHEEGYAAGKSEGMAEGLAETRSEATRLAALIEQIDNAGRHLDQSVADDVLALSLEVARQVIRQALRVKPELLLAVVREALAALPHADHPILYLHPDDAALVREHLGEQIQHAGWRITDNMSITPGGCRVETGNSEVDGTLETRWKRSLEAIGLRQDWLE